MPLRPFGHDALAHFPARHVLHEISLVRQGFVIFCLLGHVALSSEKRHNCHAPLALLLSAHALLGVGDANLVEAEDCGHSDHAPNGGTGWATRPGTALKGNLCVHWFVEVVEVNVNM